MQISERRCCIRQVDGRSSWRRQAGRQGREGKGSPPLAVCLPAVLSVKPRNSSHLQCRDGLGAQKVPHRRCVSFSHACLSTSTLTFGAVAVVVVVRPLRRECVHPALPAFLRAVWLVHVLPARGMVRVVGEEPATQTFPPLTLFRSGWRARWAEAESEWVGGQGSIPNH